MLQLFIKAGACVNQLDIVEKTPFHYAALGGNFPALKYLNENFTKSTQIPIETSEENQFIDVNCQTIVSLFNNKIFQKYKFQIANFK